MQHPFINAYVILAYLTFVIFQSMCLSYSLRFPSLFFSPFLSSFCQLLSSARARTFSIRSRFVAPEEVVHFGSFENASVPHDSSRNISWDAKFFHEQVTETMLIRPLGAHMCAPRFTFRPET